jgi:hypothetical protein
MQVPAEADRDRRVVRPEQPTGDGPRHAPARDRPRHRRPRRPTRPGLESRRHPAGCHAPCLRQLARDGRDARRLAGDVPGLREDLPPLPATDEPGRLPMPVRGPLAADVRVHGRPGTQARRACDRRGVGELAGEVCGLRDRASPGTQAEGGRLALQMPSPERTRLAIPVTMRRPAVKWAMRVRASSRVSPASRTIRSTSSMDLTHHNPGTPSGRASGRSPSCSPARRTRSGSTAPGRP